MVRGCVPLVLVRAVANEGLMAGKLQSVSCSDPLPPVEDGF